jgi:hypothetical protein
MQPGWTLTITDFASTALAPVWAFTAFMLIAKARGSETLSEGVAFAVLSIFELLNQPIPLRDQR